MIAPKKHIRQSKFQTLMNSFTVSLTERKSVGKSFNPYLREHVHVPSGSFSSNTNISLREVFTPWP